MQISKEMLDVHTSGYHAVETTEISGSVDYGLGQKGKLWTGNAETCMKWAQVWRRIRFSLALEYGSLFLFRCIVCTICMYSSPGFLAWLLVACSWCSALAARNRTLFFLASKRRPVVDEMEGRHAYTQNSATQPSKTPFTYVQFVHHYPFFVHSILLRGVLSDLCQRVLSTA